jgi:DNA repair protein RadC
MKTTTRTTIIENNGLKVGELKTTYKRLQPAADAFKVMSSKDLNAYFRPLFEDIQDTKERFIAVYLNRSNRIICYEIISEGGPTATVVEPQQIIRGALMCNAQAIALCHNHPSGETKPSQPDRNLTSKMKQAADLFNIVLLDHLILGDSYLSFADEGLM